MKHLVLGFVALLTVQFSFSQIEAVSEFLEARHIVKTNLAGYPLGAFSAHYEYKTGTRTSVGMFAGYKLPTAYSVSAIGELNSDQQTYTGLIEPSGYFVNPYVRLYAGTDGAMSGFYVEPFLRYYSLDFRVPYDYEKESQLISASLDGAATGFGGGLALGGQFNLAPRVFMDINAGFGIASGNVYMVTDDENLDADDFADIKRNIDENRDDAEIEIFLLGNIINEIEADANETSAWAEINNQLFPIFRGGISIGYAF